MKVVFQAVLYGTWVLGNGIPREDVIEVMLQVENVVFDDETKRNDAPSDHAPIVEMVLRDSFNHVSQKNVIAVPEIDEQGPGKFLIPVGGDPFILGIAGSAILRIDGREYEPDMVIRRGVDQVSKLFLARPRAGLMRSVSRSGERLFIGESLEGGQVPDNRLPKL